MAQDRNYWMTKIMAGPAQGDGQERWERKPCRRLLKVPQPVLITYLFSALFSVFVTSLTMFAAGSKVLLTFCSNAIVVLFLKRPSARFLRPLCRHSSTTAERKKEIYTIILLKSVCLSAFANCRSEFLLNRLGKCLKLFVSLKAHPVTSSCLSSA